MCEFTISVLYVIFTWQFSKKTVFSKVLITCLEIRAFGKVNELYTTECVLSLLNACCPLFKCILIIEEVLLKTFSELSFWMKKWKATISWTKFRKHSVLVNQSALLAMSPASGLSQEMAIIVNRIYKASQSARYWSKAFTVICAFSKEPSCLRSGLDLPAKVSLSLVRRCGEMMKALRRSAMSEYTHKSMAKSW